MLRRTFRALFHKTQQSIMVIRKPVASRLIPPGGQQTSNTRPYSATRTSIDGTDSHLQSVKAASDTPSSHESLASDLRNIRDGHQLRRSSGGVDMSDPWADEAAKRQQAHNQLPPALRVGQGTQSTERIREQEGIPSSLRIGPLEGTSRTSQESQRSEGSRLQPVSPAAAEANKQQQDPYKPQHTANPFSRTGASIEQHVSKEEESSAGVWNEMAARPPAPLRAPPSQQDERTGGMLISTRVFLNHFGVRCGLTGSLCEDGTPISMTANLSITDRPFSEFSPSYRPSNPDMNSQYHNESSHPSIYDRQFSMPISPHEIPPQNVVGPSPPTHKPPSIPLDSDPPPTPILGQESATSAKSSFTHRTTPSIGWDPGTDISALDAATSRNHGLSSVGEISDSQYVPRTWEEQQAWERRERELRANNAAAAAERAEGEERERKAEEEWYRGEEKVSREEALTTVDTAPFGVDGQSQNRERTDSSPRLRNWNNDLRPVPLQSGEPILALPPRRSHESEAWPPEKAPRPQLAVPAYGSGPSSAGVETPQTKTKRQRSETYQIKQINWHDASSTINPRRSPILIQNANGPCPLLALVNALIISTPADTTAALVETLRVREQVSLGLLLDAVFDELMSGRRGGAAQELPDVGDLYTFLITLHTGMNVNPRFIALPPKRPNIMDASVLNLPASINDDRKPGGFEETREMRLYGAFNIPLIHGWLPPRSHPAYIALARSAKTYEDAQNLLFREEELEEKLEREGLRPDEQILLEDIASMKYFLSSSATQLTEFGLNTITEALYPGSIAILFRNDHFSTLYKHPTSNQLLTLVTDMGYAGHEEVVWESLVDVSGEGCEFYAGDFRPVGNVAGDTQPQADSMLAGDEGWTTVDRSSNRARNSNVSSIATSGRPVSNTEPRLDQTIVLPTLPATEQEDHDLALALQLQEEEEDRHRRETAARRREDELSQAFLNSEEPSNQRGRGRGQEIRPLIPPRGTARPANTGSANEDAPPPSYEQAARGPAYHPPLNHPAHPHTSPGGARPGQVQGRQMSAYSQNAAVHVGERPSHHGQGHRRSVGVRAPGVNVSVGGPVFGGAGMTRRRSAGIGGSPLEVEAAKKDKDCIVM